MIKVWTDAAESGLLDRYGERGSTFAYLPDISSPRERYPSQCPFGSPPKV